MDLEVGRVDIVSAGMLSSIGHSCIELVHELNYAFVRLVNETFVCIVSEISLQRAISLHEIIMGIKDPSVFVSLIWCLGDETSLEADIVENGNTLVLDGAVVFNPYWKSLGLIGVIGFGSCPFLSSDMDILELDATGSSGVSAHLGTALQSEVNKLWHSAIQRYLF